MLASLTIKNFSLIENLTLDFCPRLNVFTGSTGAGKSIIIDGLRFVLGERLNNSQIRDQQQPCSVEAVFALSPALWQHELLSAFFSPEEDQIIIQRQYFSDGKTKVRINGMSVTLALLKQIGDLLTDFHGPHDHQMLLSKATHIGILDRLANFGDFKERYTHEFSEHQDLKLQLQALTDMAQSRQRDLELLNHQINELSQVPLATEVFEELCHGLTRMNNAEKLFENASLLLGSLENEESGISEQISRAFGPLRNLNLTDESSLKLNDLLTGMQEKCVDLVSALRDYLDSLSFQPDESLEINRKYDIYENIRRKYGPTVDDAQRFLAEAKKRYSLLIDWEQNDADLRTRIKAKEEILTTLAGKISAIRRKTAEQLKSTIEKELKDLGMSHVRFALRFTKCPLCLAGFDEVEFMISPNAGEDLKPMADIVSSGEAARVMLALKRALMDVDPVPVLIFDEIDAQIGGRLGTVTGKKLKELAANRQIILITHLPQIASFADQHIKVCKRVENGRTLVTAQPLDQPSRIEELSHMMSGEKRNRISLSHAEDMLSDAQASAASSKFD